LPSTLPRNLLLCDVFVHEFGLFYFTYLINPERKYRKLVLVEKSMYKKMIECSILFF
jgi:hypothetical protein